MENKITIYSQKPEESPIPVTVRIEWLADGTIKPTFYWTPDGSCYKIKNVLEMTPLNYLKKRGKGIRFEVIAEVIETSYSELLYTAHKSYLYLADNWFCGKNIIDDRYSHNKKMFISVTLDVFPNLKYELVYFWVNEMRYTVEKTLSIEPHGSFYAGGVGIRHKVRARQINLNNDEDLNPLKSIIRVAALYFEFNKWFVTIKTE